MTQPRVSLITPTEGRFAEICALVGSVRASLAAFGGGRGESPIEMIFVDSTEPPFDTGEIEGWDPGFMRLLSGSRNVRQKRNMGARAARAPWLAFVDSDCVVAADYVEKLIDATRDGTDRAFAGRIIFQGEENRLWEVIAETQLTRVETQTDGQGEVPWCATANLIVTRRLFDSLGGFDETLPFRLGGDDVDFGLRLGRSGTPLSILPSVVVYHPKVHWSRLGAILPRAWRWGRIEYHLSLRHPERVRTMPPYVMAKTVGVLLAAIVGAVFSGHPALLATIPMWIALTIVLQTWLSGGGAPFSVRCLGRCIQLYYHFGTIREHLAFGSLRFLWEALIIERRMDGLFPNEVQEDRAFLFSTLITAAAGLLLVRCG